MKPRKNPSRNSAEFLKSRGKSGIKTGAVLTIKFHVAKPVTKGENIYNEQGTRCSSPIPSLLSSNGGGGREKRGSLRLRLR